MSLMCMFMLLIVHLCSSHWW